MQPATCGVRDSTTLLQERGPCGEGRVAPCPIQDEVGPFLAAVTCAPVIEEARIQRARHVQILHIVGDDLTSVGGSPEGILHSGPRRTASRREGVQWSPRLCRLLQAALQQVVPESAAWLLDFFEGNLFVLLLVGVLVADVCVEVLLDTKVLRAELARKVVSFQMLLIKMLPKLALRQKLELTAWCAAVITLLLLMQLEMLLERRLLNEHLLTALELAAIRFLPSLEMTELTWCWR